MANKDHLPTNEENNKRQKRDLKRIVSSNYQSAPPVLTQDITDTGTVARTTGEVRDVDFPILKDIADLTDNLQTIVAGSVKTIQVELGKQEAQFQRLLLDDDGGSITDFIIDFVGLAKNKALEFIADIETQFTGTPIITFNPPLAGLPPAFGDSGSNKFKMLVSAIETPAVTSYQVINGEGGSSIGASFPILWPKENLTPSSGGTATIDISLTTGNAKQIQFPGGDISFAISGDPTGAVAESVVVIFIQDATGGRSLTAVDGAIKNGNLMDGLLDKVGGAKTTFRFTTHDEGISYHAELVDLSTGATVTSLNDLTDVAITGAVAGQSLIFNGTIWTEANVSLSTITIDATKNWNGKNIINLGSLEPSSNSVQLLGTGTKQWNTLWVDTLENQTSITISPPILSLSTPVLNLGGDSDDAIHFIGKAATDLNMSTFDIDGIDRLTFMFNASTFGTPLTQSSKGFSSLLNGVRLNLLIGADPDPNGSFVVALEEDPLLEVESVNRNLILYDTDFRIFFNEGELDETSFNIVKSASSTNLDDTDKIFLSINGTTVMNIIVDEIALGNSVSIRNVDQIGFRKLGNLIEDSDDGMRFVVRPFDVEIPDLGQFTWANTIDGQGDATNVFASLDSLGFSINDGYLQMGQIAVPDNPPAGVGRLFFDSGNSEQHLTIKRITSTFDLEANWSTFKATTDVDMDSFDIHTIDGLLFMDSPSFVGEGLEILKGFTSLQNGIRANVIEDGSFEITSLHNLMFAATNSGGFEGFNTIRVVDSLFSVDETVGGTSFGIAKTFGATALTEPTEINLQIATIDIIKINSSTVDLADNISIANVDQIGFRALGNLIEDKDLEGLRFVTRPFLAGVLPEDGPQILGQFTWANGIFGATGPVPDVYATLDIDGLHLNNMYLQLDGITVAVVGGTGGDDVGRLFIDSSNNHFSIIRNETVIDLEAGGADVSLWATFPASTNVDFNSKNAIDIDQLLFKDVSGDFATADDKGFVASATRLLANVPLTGRHNWRIGNIENMRLFADGNDTLFDVISRVDGGNPEIRLVNKESLATPGIKLGEIDFIADDAANTDRFYARIQSDIEDIATGALEGSLKLRATTGSVLTTFLSINDSANGMVKLHRDLDANTFDVTGVDRLLFEVDSEVFTSGSDKGFVGADEALIANVPTGDQHEWDVNKIRLANLFKGGTSTDTLFSLFSATNGGIPRIRLFNQDPSPTIGTRIGKIDFFGFNDDTTPGPDNVTYASVSVDIENFSDDLEEGSLHLNAQVAGSEVTFLSINNSADETITAFRDLVIDDGRNIIMNTDADILLNGNQLKLNSGGTNIIDGPTSAVNITAGGSLVAVFNSLALTLQPSIDLNTRGVIFADTNFNFTVNGAMWLDTSNGKFMARENGVDFELSAGGGVNGHVIQDEGSPLPQRTNLNFVGAGVAVTDVGSVTTVTIPGATGGDASQWATFDAVTDVDFKTFDAIGVDRLLFAVSSGGFVDGTAKGFVATNIALLANVPDGNHYELSINNVRVLTLDISSDDTRLDMYTKTNGGVPKIRLFNQDPSPTISTKIGELDFLAKNDNDNNIFYARVSAEIENFIENAEAGSLDLRAAIAGSLVTFLSINNSNDGNITAFRDLTMDAGRDIVMAAAGTSNILLNDNQLILNDELDNIIQGGGDSISITADGTSMAVFSATQLTLQTDIDLLSRVVFHDSTTFNVLVDGAIWFDGTNLKGREGGADFILSATGGGASPLTTKGDLFTFSTVNARLGVGSNGQVLVADSAESTGLNWATSSGGVDLLPLNNIWTGTNEFTKVVEIVSNVNGVDSIFRLINNDTGLTHPNIITRIEFVGKNDATVPGNIDYATIFGVAEDDAEGLEEGGLSLRAIHEGNQITFIRLNDDGGDGFIRFNRPVKLSADSVFIDFRETTSGSAIDAGPPGTNDIRLFNDSDTGELSVLRSDDTVVSLEGGGDASAWSEFIATQDVNFDTWNIVNLDALEQTDVHTLLHTFARPETLVDDSVIGEIIFRAFDGVGTINNYAMIKGVMDSDDNTEEAGRIEFWVVENGDHTGERYIDIDGDVKVVQFFRDISMLTNAIILDIDTDVFIESITTNVMTFSTGDELRLSITNDSILPAVEISMSNLHKITNLVDPTLNQDAATKKYVDDNIGGGGGTTFPIDFPERPIVNPAGSALFLSLDLDTRHARKYVLNQNFRLVLRNELVDKTSYVNFILVQDGTGGHTFTLESDENEDIVNKEIVENGVLLGPNEETGIVVKWSFGKFYAFLETGNRVSGGGNGGGASSLSELTIDTNKDWETFNITNIGDIIPNGDSAETLGLAGNRWDTLFVEKISGGTIAINSTTLDINSTTLNINSNTIDIGEDTASDIDFKGRVDSDFVPKTTASRDLGITDFNWKSLWVGTIVSDGNLELQSSTKIVLGAPGNPIDISGDIITPIIMKNSTPTGSSPAGEGRFFAKVGVSGLTSPFWRDSDNTEIELTGGGGGSPNLSGLIIDVKKDWLAKGISNFGELTGVTKTIFTFGVGLTLATSVITQTGDALEIDLLDGTDKFEIEVGSKDAFRVDLLKTEILSTTPELTSAKLSLFRTDTSPEDNDTIGEIQFRGQNSAAEPTEYGKIDVAIFNKTNNLEDGIMRFWHKDGGRDVNVLSLVDGRLTLLRHDAAETDQGEAEMRILKEVEEPSALEPIGDLDFGIAEPSTGTFVTYATIQAIAKTIPNSGILSLQVRTDNSLHDALVIEGNPGSSPQTIFKVGINANARMQPTGISKMAYFVSEQTEDLSVQIGQSGTLEIPRLSNNNPSKNQLDAAFGNFLGVIGYETVDSILYIKVSTTEWKGVSLPISVT